MHPPGSAAGRRRRVRLIAPLLVLATVAVYAQVRNHDFVNLDDGSYVTDKPLVTRGLTLEGLRWAFTSAEDANWLPLTRLSHMLDCQLFGVNPGAHHLVSVSLHAVNTLLVFRLLLALTGAAWASGFVAALFGLHPLHVESVAWVAERKDVLSALFWLLAMGAYLRYARRPGPGRAAAVAGLFALGLLAKPMVVTLPFALLLLDFWPLGRLPPRPQSLRVPARLLLEKLPLFALAAAAAAATFLVQRGAGAVWSVEQLSIGERAGNALLSYARYLGMLFWPVDLGVFYPHPRHLPGWAVAAAGLPLALVTALALGVARARPAVAAGWLWYLGTLVPVIGLVQVGSQALADRYLYLPSTGLFVAAAWGLGDLAARVRRGRAALALAAVAALAACAGATARQVAVWRDSVTLFEHALAAGWESPLAHYNLGHALAARGRRADAIGHYRAAVRLKPDEPALRDNLGLLLAEEGRTAEGIAEIREALRYKPDSASALNNLAWILGATADDSLRDGVAAVGLAERASALTGNRDPGQLDTLAVAYAAAGRLPEAAAAAERAIALARGRGDLALAGEIGSRLGLYRAGLPYREPARRGSP